MFERIFLLRLMLSVAIGFLTGCAPAVVGQAQPAPPPSQCSATAGNAYGWGTPSFREDFDSTGALTSWHVYDGPGHDGNGRRTPAAVTVADGTLSITGDAAGNSGGMGWAHGQRYGRWEVCARSPQAAPNYHSVALLWPDAEDWPVGGEIDFMEAISPNRQTVEGWLHFGEQDNRIGGEVAVDATAWHAWAVEWLPNEITFFIDGRPWWRTTDVNAFPPRPMHLCLQMDNFGGDISAGGVLQTDWVSQYAVQ